MSTRLHWVGCFCVAIGIASAHADSSLPVAAGRAGAPGSGRSSGDWGVTRIGDMDEPPTLVRIDFERAPDGRALRIGDDLQEAFVGKGVRLSTSIATSFVGANSYIVGGRSRGNSAATVRPVWEGVMTIRFCRPGNPSVAAGVTRFGLWIAQIFPHGTKLRALDARGGTLGEIETTVNGDEFLGFRSAVPIYAVQVIPNPAIDRNYTVDDLVFDPPR